MEAFDQTLEEIFELSGSISLMSLMDDITENLEEAVYSDLDYDEMMEKLNTPYPGGTVKLTYPEHILPETTRTYQIRDILDLLTKVGEFYSQELTPEQLNLIRLTNPKHEVNFLESPTVYDTLIEPHGMRTELICLIGRAGEYTVELDWTS